MRTSYAKFVNSFSSTNINSKLNTSASSNTIKKLKSPSQLKNPFKQIKPSKFPKNRIRKQTQMNMLIQTTQISRRSSVKTFHSRNSSVIFDQYQSPKKKKNSGLFNNKISRQSLVTIVQNRSFQDIGMDKNKRGQNYRPYPKPDPIMFGQNKKQTKTHYQLVWKEGRKWRDQGNRIKDKFIWDTKKNKGYLDRYHAAKELTNK